MKSSILALLGITTCFGGALAATFALAAPQKRAAAAKAARVDFDADVRPILSEHCFACHGPDAATRKAGLRLDTPEGAREKLASGRMAVVAGMVKESTLHQRVTATGALQMPPPSFNKPLTKKQIAVLEAWIAQGGNYAPHWAFVTPARPAVPTVKAKSWPKNPIDAFLLARMESEGLVPSPEADRATLLRRVTFDLTGLPPTLKELDDFLGDKSPNAYEKVVDRLLASPRYGERMATFWMDLSRYADTHGYHIDSHRDMWPWRDWVIKAFNKGMPYDQFIVEQLAGDLLPNPTLDQKIATGFNRNHPINFEGGAIPEEYAAAYIFDRIDTTFTSLMGLTMRCAQCHDHKYDPLSAKDFYQAYAFFNTVPEQGLDGTRGNAVPYLKAPSPEQEAQLAYFNRKVSETETALKQREAEGAAAFAAWLKEAAANPTSVSVSREGLAAEIRLDESEGDRVTDAAERLAQGVIKGKAERAAGKVDGALKLDGTNYIDLGTSFGFDTKEPASFGAWVNPAVNEHMAIVSRMDDPNSVRGWDLYLGDGRVYVHLISKWEENAIRVNTKTQIKPNAWSHVFATYDGSGKAAGVKIYIDGTPADLDITHDRLTGSIATDKPVHVGRRSAAAPFKGLIDELRLYRRALTPGEVETLAGFETLRAVLLTEDAKRTPEQRQSLAKFYFGTVDAPYQKTAAELADLRKKRDDLDKAIPTTMVMQEMEKPRETFMLIRGEYDKKGEKVTAGVPAIFANLPQPETPNRLGFAKWLVHPKHPLTARVAGNQYWQMIFGTGLVKSAENFGLQGDRPSHPELLDWLAVEFQNPTTRRPDEPTTRAWDIKRLLRMMVTSAAYRQSSKVTPALLTRDPENRLLARGPRVRLQAEFIRDQALLLSGLFVGEIGGPSVRPYQPAGLWEDISFKGDFTAQYYVQDHGEKLYRRGMYTFWKRTCPPPSLQTFDAPEREFCIVRRSVTNTPLQALVLMNDPTYVEASRKMAERVLREAPAARMERIKHAFRMAACRYPTPKETQVLSGIFAEQMTRFRTDRRAAEGLLKVGESPADPKIDAAELAAWASLMSVILNMDEVITKN
jgi:mono/diheme cytochrome c family protein